MFAVVYYTLNRAEKGNIPTVRRVAALDAIEEAVGRATELGKPVLTHMGYTGAGLRGPYSGIILAGLSIMNHVVDLCASLGTRIIVAPAYPELLPTVHETVRSAYAKYGKPEEYNENDIIFFSNQQFPWATGVMGLMERERPGAHIATGPFHAESLMVAESSARIGCISIIGTPRKSQIPFFIAACDYTLIGEECFAAGAYLSKDPGQIGTISGQDWIKMICIALIILGTIFLTFGSSLIVDLLKI